METLLIGGGIVLVLAGLLILVATRKRDAVDAQAGVHVGPELPPWHPSVEEEAPGWIGSRGSLDYQRGFVAGQRHGAVHGTPSSAPQAPLSDRAFMERL